MTKKRVLFAFIGLTLFFSTAAYAHSMDEYATGRHGYGMMEKGEGQQCPVAGKFMKKAHFLLENKADLGLTDEQVKAIKDMKLQVEKDGIRQNADREIFMLDLKSKLEADKVDVEGTNALIDKGFASLAASTKSNVEAYSKLKDSLTPDQLAKMKEFWKNKKEGGESHTEELRDNGDK